VTPAWVCQRPDNDLCQPIRKSWFSIVNFVKQAVFLRFFTAPRRFPPIAVFSVSTFIAVFGFLLMAQTTGKTANSLYISIGYYSLASPARKVQYP
jgi:hypothetical protein